MHGKQHSPTSLPDGDDEVPCLGVAVQLRQHLDLLSSSEQIVHRHSGDTGHLDMVDDQHELLHEAQGQVGILFGGNREGMEKGEKEERKRTERGGGEREERDRLDALTCN